MSVRVPADRRRATIIVEWAGGSCDAYVQRMVERHADEIMTNLVNQGVGEPSVSGALNEDGSLPIERRAEGDVT